MGDLFLSIGSSAQSHKEGDVWQEGSKTWTIKNGIKRTISKLASVREEHLVPLCCPKCNGTMKGPVNEIMWKVHKSCINCVVLFEHDLITNGQWEAYQRAKVTANAEAFCLDMEGALQDYLSGSIARSRVTEDGIVERWRDPNKATLQQIADNELNQLRNMIDEYKQEPSEDTKGS